MFKFFFVLLTVIVCAMPDFAQAASQAGQNEPPMMTAPITAASDRVMGSADAPVEIVVYTSFICGKCADWHTYVLPALRTLYVDKGLARIVVRDLPSIPFELSGPSAAIARCAAPGRFFAVVDALMTGQASVTADGSIEDWYKAAIVASGRDRPTIEACVGDPATRAAIIADSSLAENLGFHVMPGVTVGGVVLDDPTLEGVNAAIASIVMTPTSEGPQAPATTGATPQDAEPQTPRSA